MKTIRWSRDDKFGATCPTFCGRVGGLVTRAESPRWTRGDSSCPLASGREFVLKAASAALQQNPTLNHE